MLPQIKQLNEALQHAKGEAAIAERERKEQIRKQREAEVRSFLYRFCSLQHVQRPWLLHRAHLACRSGLSRDCPVMASYNIHTAIQPHVRRVFVGL